MSKENVEIVRRSIDAYNRRVFEVRSDLIARMCLYQETHEALEAAGLSE